jgi:hypothetical protein
MPGWGCLSGALTGLTTGGILHIPAGLVPGSIERRYTVVQLTLLGGQVEVKFYSVGISLYFVFLNITQYTVHSMYNT